MKIYSPEQANKTLLKRQPMDLQETQPGILQGIREIFGEALTPAEAVRVILKEIRSRGDAAILDWNTRLDGNPKPVFRVPAGDMEAALLSLPQEQADALKEAADRVERFHRRQPATSWVDQSMGGTLGQLLRPIGRVGLYIPGGTAPLPSTLLMTAVPARVAGVGEIAVCSPAERTTGKIHPVTLAAAAISGVEEVYAIGGAQAIGAMAFGTASLPAVDKIFGPGNLFVTLAKQQVYGTVGIDTLAGPTETVIIADESASPSRVAIDLLAQAEHDPLAAAILLTPSRRLAEAVNAELERLLGGDPSFSRREILERSLDDRSGIVLTGDLDEAVALSNRYAPEHLNLVIKDPWDWISKITAAGGIFVGEDSCEVLGDYAAGPSHVMPTGGSARFASPVNVWDFLRIISLVALSPEGAAGVAKTSALIARMEGLDAHARSAEARSGNVHGGSDAPIKSKA